jgi:sigma-B regulation protein RsbU (phosphoserine phosphatase)
MNDTGLSRCSQLESCALWRILDATRNLAAPLGVDETLQKAIDSSLQVLNAERASVFLYDPRTDELYMKVSTRLPESGSYGRNSDSDDESRHDASRIIRFPADAGIAGETAQKRRLVNVPDCYADPRFNREVDRRTGYVTRCMLSVPLLGVDEALVGVLQVLNKHAGPFDEDDERIATILAAHCAVVLQRAMLLEEYVLKQKMERDLALAREIQMSSLPQQMPTLAGYEFTAWSLPADEAGGDVYDALNLGEQRVALLMADATGHGIGPAISVSQLRAMFRMGLLLGADLAELMSKINLQLTSDLPAGRFITAFAGILDSTDHKIHYISGGQAPLMHFRAAEDRVDWLDASTLPMGIQAWPPLIFPPAVEMRPGDIFALISDGIFDYADRTGELFGKERVEDLIRSRRNETLEEIRKKLCETVRVFSGGLPQEDDMTVLFARRNADCAAT